MGFGEKRNTHRPAEIQLPVIVPDEDSERTYNAGHFTTIRDFPLKSKTRKRRLAEAYEEPFETSATTAHLATGTLRETVLGLAYDHSNPFARNFNREQPPHTSNPYKSRNVSRE